MEFGLIVCAAALALLAGVVTYKGVFGPKRERIALAVIASVSVCVSLLSGIVC